MKREIKFRAWDAKEKQMLEVNHLFNLDNKQPIEVWTNDYEGGYRFNPDKLEIMQYTGLRDKTGREIYEGDILRDPDDGYVVGKVEYDWGAFVCSGYDMYDSSDYKVIGNIYENPELLEAEK